MAGDKVKTIFIKDPPEITGTKDGMFRVRVTDADGNTYRLIWTVKAFFASYVAKGQAIREFEQQADVEWLEPDEGD